MLPEILTDAIDPEITKRMLSNLSSLGLAYGAELGKPLYLGQAQIEALTNLTAETQEKMIKAMMNWRWLEMQDIQVVALNGVNRILYGEDFAAVTTRVFEEVAEDSARLMRLTS